MSASILSIHFAKIFFPAALAFIFGILATPGFTHFFYKYKMWKKVSRISGDKSDDFKQVHNETEELRTPRVGGMIIWTSVIFITGIFALASDFFPSSFAEKMSFLSRNQTLLPFGTLIAGAAIGLFDDFMQIFSTGEYSNDAVENRYIKIGVLVALGAAVGFWFFSKLDVHSIHIPFVGPLELGILFVPFFVIIMLAVFSTSVIDGIDGLSGGVLSSIFASYSLIALSRDQIDLAAFCAVITGAILAFLWFNIPPARFYMGETGMLSLTLTLSTIAVLTDTILLLPIIAFPLVMTSLSVIVQMTSKRFFGKKVFRVAPIHHHFEAIGWPPYKVVMRFWVLSAMCAIIGSLVAIVS